MPIITHRWNALWPGQTRFRQPLTSKRPWLAGLLLLMTSLGAQAQLTGNNYTINPAGAAPGAAPYANGTNFNTFSQAIAALNATSPIPAGGVTFNVAKVAYTEPTGTPAITASGTAANPIIFQENGLTATLADNPTVTRTTGGSGTTDNVFVISGGDFITFDGINVVGAVIASPNQIEFGYMVRNSSATNGAKNNTIRNARITVDRNYTASVGLFQTSSTTGGGTLATSTGGINQNNTYENLTVESAYKGIYLLTGNTTGTNYDFQNIVRNCTVGTSVASAPTGSIGDNTSTTVTAGIQVTRQNQVQVYDNEVQNVAATGIVHGIHFEATYGAPNRVSGNRIHDIRNSSLSSTSATYGLRLDIVATAAAGGATGHTINAYNNFIYGITQSFVGTPTGTVRTFGIATNITTSTVAGSFINVYYNSVRMENPADYTASSAAFSQNGTTTTPLLTLRNNIFADFSPAQTGTAKHVAIDAANATQFGPTGSTSNYNDLYVANSAVGQNGFVGLTSTTDRRTLADWQGAVSQDANSKSVDPGFVSATDLHATSLLLNNQGIAAASITTVDIDGQTRGANPDIGADEFSPAPDDVAVGALVTPATPATVGPQSVEVNITNNGGNTLNTVTLQYTLNGGAPVSQTFTIPGGLASAQTTALTFTVPAALQPGQNIIVVTGSLPNGSADPTASNNSSTTTVYTPLAGVYTINQSAPASNSNFVSFTSAATALNTIGISDAVRFNVLNGPYSEQFSLGVIAGVSATDTIVVDGGASKQTLTYTGNSTQPAAVLLNGTDYLTLNNLTIDVAANSTYGIGVLLVGDANFNRVSNSVVRASLTSTSSTTAAIAISGGVASSTSGGTATDLRVENNTISGGYHAFIATGTSTTLLTGIRVTGNTITDTYTYAIDLEFTDGATVLGNDISRPTRTSTTTFSGVYFTSATLNALVSRNRIHDPATAMPTTTSGMYGIYFTSADGTPGNGNQVTNNLIYNFVSGGIQYGLYNSGSNYGLFYHNTVSLDHTASTSGSVAYGIYQSGQADGVEFRNNIVSVTRGGAANRVALNFGTNTSNITSDHNDLFVGTGGTFFTGSFSAALYVTLADWQTANGGLYDQNSVQTDPRFVAGTLVPNSAVLNGTGDPALLTIVPRDFNNVLRNNPPDPGAYEFTPVSNDVAVTGLTSPTAPFGAGSTPVSVTVLNAGGGTISSVTLTYTYNGGAPVTQTFTGLSLTGGQSTVLTFATPVTVVAGVAPLVVTATLPNGAADDDNSNNTLNINLRTALAGVYTINDQAAASATNFVSFTAAATALNEGGVSDAVRFDVLNGPYTEQISIGEIAGVNASDTVVFNGNGRTIRFGSTTASQKAVIQLNGSDYVTIDNLVINANHTGATFGWGVHLTNAADNNRISNSTITSGQSTTLANFNGIVASATINDPSSNGTNANNARIENNTISGGGYGIILSGANASGLAAASRITGNTVQDFYQYGILVEFQNGTLIKGNDVSRPTRTTVTSFYGVYVTGSLNTDVESNRIHDNFTGNPASTSAAYGIYVSASDGSAGNEIDVVNNIVYNFNGSGIEDGIYNSSSDYVRYYHNTVSLDNTAVNTTSATAGFFQTGLATGIEFVNNIVSVRRNPLGTGDKNALDFSTTTSVIFSDKNDLYITPGPDSFTGSYGTAGFATLADWRTANGNSYDQNSFQVNPFFDASYKPAAAALDGTGSTATLARVPRDIASVLRSSPPDLGAYEFVAAAEDVAVVSITAPATPAAAGLTTVTVTIRNNGTLPLTFVTLAYSLNGGTPVSQTFTGLNVASGATTSLSFATQANLVAGPNSLSVTGSLPNGNPDSNAVNDTQTIVVNTPLAGVYTINNLQPTGGTNFESFTAAATALNTAGVSDAVRFNVLNGPYVEQMQLTAITGASATDTVVFNGNGRTIRFGSTLSAQRAVVWLNGADFVTIDNLIIDATNNNATPIPTYGYGVLLTNAANNNRISNSSVLANQTSTSSTNHVGIATSGSSTSFTTAPTATTMSTGLRLENNTVQGGYYGIIVNGVTATPGTGLRITGNTVQNSYLYGIDVEGQRGAVISGNNISRPTRPDLSTFAGVYLTTSRGALIERNRIHNPFGGEPASTSAGYGVYITGADATAAEPNLVVNNLIYNFTGNGTQYGLYNVGSDHARYYHNSVSLNHPGVTTASATTGFYQTTAATGIEFMNNVVSVTRNPTGAGDKNAVDFGTTTSTIVSNYNDLYVSSGTDVFTGTYGTTSYTTLASWRNANGGAYDQNSVQMNPNFVNAAGGDLTPGSNATLLDRTGNPALLALVPRDFNNVVRNNPPDLGAIEFTAIFPDLVVSTTQTGITGAYNNVTITGTGNATLGSTFIVYGTLTVQSGGILSQNCQPVNGSGNFILNAGAELRICDPNGLSASGSTGAIRNTGTRSFSTDASYVYNGTVAQVTGAGLPATVRSLTVNNAAGLTLSQALSVRQLARLQSGNLATGGNAFVLLSTVSGTALIDNTGGVVTGTGTMQRASNGIPGLAYRHYSAPVSNTTLADLTTSNFAPELSQAAAYNTSPTPGTVTPFPNIFGYDETRVGTVVNNQSAFDKGWFAPLSASAPMTVNRGYTVRIPNSALVDFVGTFNNGAQSSGTLTRGTDPEAGWQLLGNPYPAPLDWSTVTGAQLPGMDNAMYVFQATGVYVGNYRSYVNGVGASPLINAGQGYFTRVTTPGGTGSVNLTNANRVTTFGPQPVFGRGTVDSRPQLKLQVSGAGLDDETYVYFEQGATASLDASYDAVKMPNTHGLNLASRLGNQELAINGLPSLIGARDIIVPLSLLAPQAGSFSFEVPTLANFGAARVFLRDAATGTEQQLTAGARYSFTLATALAGGTRFSLVFRPSGVTASHAGFEAAQVSVYPNPATAKFTVLLPPVAGQKAVTATLLNALGQSVQSRTIALTAAGATAEFNTSGLAAGVYVLRLEAGDSILTKRVVVE